MFSFTEYYRRRFLERDERVNIIINNYFKERIINKKKRKYDEIIDKTQNQKRK
jgi:hypothetical protein